MTCVVAGCGSSAPPPAPAPTTFEFDADSDPILGALGYVDEELLIEIFPGADPEEIADLLEQLDALVIEDLDDLAEIDLMGLEVDADELEAIAGELDLSDLIESVQKNYIFEPEQSPDDPLFAAQTYLAQIGVPEAWDVTTGSETITIAIVDSGIDATHPDLINRVVGGWNVHDNNADYSDVTGHGTKVAGIAAAATNNAIGISGVTWACPLLAVRVTDAQGRATARDLASGILWSVKQGAKVINVSFAPLWSNPVVRSAAERAWASGAIVVISTGNDANVTNSPGYEQAIFVGALGDGDLIAPFSDRGPFVDLVAPGVGIRTTGIGADYPLSNGTSFAAPMVTGVLGLAWSVNPQLRPATVANTLLDTALDLGDSGVDNIYGRGSVDAAAAVAQASQAIFVPDTSIPIVSIVAPSAGDSLTGRAAAEVTATDDWGVDRVEMSIDGIVMGTDKRSPYRFLINTAKFAVGSHVVSFVATDLSGNASAEVSVSVTFAAAGLSTASASAPSVEFTSPASGTSVTGGVTITATVSAEQGLAGIEWVIDDMLVLASPISGESSGVSYHWTATGASPGSHTVTLVVTAADGTVAQDTLVLRID